MKKWRCWNIEAKKWVVIRECFSYPAEDIVFIGTKKECKNFIKKQHDCWLTLAFVEKSDFTT